MYLQDKIANTILGKIHIDQIGMVFELVGIKTDRPIVGDGFYEEKISVSPVKAWHKNSSEDKRSNEKDLIKTDIQIPIKIYNFEIALMKAEKKLSKLQDFNAYEVINEAIKIYESDYLDATNEPVYVPVDEGPDKGYGRILRETEAERKAMFYAWFRREREKEGFKYEKAFREKVKSFKRKNGLESINEVLGRIIPKS